MQHLKHRWKRLPNKLRRPLVLLLGALLILTSALIGWVPGPGGMVPFLLGIAVLATEFEWAERFRDFLLSWFKQLGHSIRLHPVLSTSFVVVGAMLAGVGAYVFYKHIL